MNWIPLTSIAQLDEIAQATSAQIIFKHSTRCPVSSMAKRTVEYNWDELPENTNIYLLDLIQYREISNAIAERWQVAHQSPQVLVLQAENCIYHASHEAINVEDIAKYL